MKRAILITLFISSITLSAKAVTWSDIEQHLKISGYLQALYTLEYADQTENSSFRIRRARVSFAGKIAESDKLGMADYRLQVDFADSPKIVDAWVRYRPFTQLGIQVGQFKIPLSIENSEYAPLKLEFIDYSLVVQRLVHMSSSDVLGINSTGRDCGAQLYGGFLKKEGYNIVNYNLAIFNGYGINQKRDNNHSKDFVGRVILSPLRDLTIASYYQYGEGNLEGKQHVDYQRYGGGIAYNGRHAFARSEYIRGNTGNLISEGAYASAGWKFHTAKAGYGSIGMRFDYFDENILTGQREFNYTIGTAYQPWKYMRLQLNYTIKQYQHFGKPLTLSLTIMVSGIF
jgi:hypothetical protein